MPITGQTFAVVLVGASLGSVRGTASMVLYLLVGLVGLPVYSEHKHGWEVISGSTGGYLLGFIAAAALTGWLAERGWDRRYSSSISAMLSGNVVIYAFGLLWLHHWLAAHGFGSSWQTTLEDGLYPFVAADLVKLYLAAAALPLAWKIVRRQKRRGGSGQRPGQPALRGGRRTANWSVISSVRKRKPNSAAGRPPAGPGSRRLPVGTSRWRRSRTRCRLVAERSWPSAARYRSRSSEMVKRSGASAKPMFV